MRAEADVVPGVRTSIVEVSVEHTRIRTIVPIATTVAPFNHVEQGHSDNIPNQYNRMQ